MWKAEYLPSAENIRNISDRKDICTWTSDKWKAMNQNECSYRIEAEQKTCINKDKPVIFHQKLLRFFLLDS